MTTCGHLLAEDAPLPRNHNMQSATVDYEHASRSQACSEHDWISSQAVESLLLISKTLQVCSSDPEGNGASKLKMETMHQLW